MAALDDVQGMVATALQAEGDRYVEDMRKRLLTVRTRVGARGSFSASSRGSGGLVNSLQATVTRGKGGWPVLTVVAPPSWRWANRGRGAGKPPPVNAIYRWIMATGLESDAKKARSFAFALAWVIGKRGTARPPSFFYDQATPPALDRIDFAVRADIPGLLADFKAA
jgi:hypothetical protein